MSGTTPTTPLDAVCHSLMRLATETSDRLRDEAVCGFASREETYTENILHDLASRHRDCLIVEPHSAYREGRQSGADWEWWFVADNACFGMRVQAKRLSFQSSDFKSLNHRTPSGKLQVDLLEEDAKRYNVWPCYVLYSYQPSDTSIPWHCGTTARDSRLLGCTILHTSHVRACIDAGDLSMSTVLSVARPWHCIVCCRGFHQGTLPQRAATFAGQFAGPKTTSFEGLQPNRSYLPEYVDRLLRKRAFNVDFATREGPSADDRGIAFTVVVVDRGTNQR